MKKGILGSTALVAVGALAASPAAADGIQLGLGGYLNTYFSVGGIDEASGSDADYNATGLFSEGEIWFLGEYRHDNGITFGARVELEAYSTSTQIDKRFIYVSGDFGRIEAGARQTAGYQMAYAAPYAGLPINSGWITVFIPAPVSQGYVSGWVAPGLTTFYDLGSGEENQISYYTPRFAGFQLGVSYVPSITFNDPVGQNFPVEADTNSQYSNGISVGANYINDFNGIGVVISGSYLFAQAPDDFGGFEYDDFQAARGGLQVSYAGVTFGGSYGKVFEGMPNSYGDVGTTTEGQSWDVGATYGMGPWTVGITYFRGSMQGFVYSDDDQKTQAIQGGVTYLLGPGITANAGVMWGKYEGNGDTFLGAGGAGAGFDDSQSGVVGAAGLTFDF